jgi:hypothetical protein
MRYNSPPPLSFLSFSVNGRRRLAPLNMNVNNFNHTIITWSVVWPCHTHLPGREQSAVLPHPPHSFPLLVKRFGGGGVGKCD